MLAMTKILKGNAGTMQHYENMIYGVNKCKKIVGNLLLIFRAGIQGFIRVSTAWFPNIV